MKLKKIFTFLVCACAFSYVQSDVIKSVAEDIKETRLRFNSKNFNTGEYDKTSSTSNDGKSLFLTNTSKHRLLFRSKEGFFKPNTDYRLTFSYKLNNADEDAVLRIIMRDLDEPTHVTDIAHVNLKNGENFQEYSMRFSTPFTPKKYAFTVYGLNSFEAEIKDVKLEYGTFEKYYPVIGAPKKYDTSDMQRPTGSEEFDVELPDGNGTIVGAEKYFIEEDCYNFIEKFNSAIEDCKKKKISKLVLPKGRYYITEEYPILLAGLQDFEIDGSGSTLVFKKKKSNSLTIRNCKRVKVSNLNFDWDWESDPLGSFVKVVSTKSSEKESYVDFFFVDYEKEDYPQRNPKVAFLSSADEEYRSVGIEAGRSIPWEMWDDSPVKEKKWVSGNTLRVFLTPKEAASFNRGDFFRMNHYYYHMNCISMESNVHLTLDNINIYSTPGHAISMDGYQEYTHLKNVNIKIPEGDKKRAVTSTADHFHIVRSKGYLKMENCEIGWGADDCLNAHDVNAVATKTGPNTAKVKLRHQSARYKIGDLIEFRNLDFSPTGIEIPLASKPEISKEEHEYELTFDEDLPEAGEQFVIFNKSFNTHNLIIRNCTFRQNRARALLILARDVTIENCKFFRNEMGAIKFETGYTLNSWCEGYGVDNVVVKDCEFESVNPYGMKDCGKVRDIFFGSYIKTDPSEEKTAYPIIQNVLFERNVFRNSFGLVAFISSAGNISFVENLFVNTIPRKNEMLYRGGFFVTYASDINFFNNVYVSSPLVKSPGVFVDKLTSGTINMKGNRVVPKELPNGFTSNAYFE